MITVCLRFRLHFLTLNWFWLNSTYFDFVHTEVVRWSRILFLFESKQSIDFNSARDALQLWSLNCVSFKKNDKKNVDVIWPIRLNDQFALFFLSVICINLMIIIYTIWTDFWKEKLDWFFVDVIFWYGYHVNLHTISLEIKGIIIFVDFNIPVSHFQNSMQAIAKANWK